MKSIFGLLVPVLFIAMFLGGCVMQYNVPSQARSMRPVPSLKTPVQTSQIFCESPAHWDIRENKLVCGTPQTATTSYIWNQPYYGYPYGGYGYGYGYRGYYGYGMYGGRRW